MPELWEDIVRYEQGELNKKETISLFSKLIKNGMAWSLQGHYGRTSVYLIENGILSKLGDILVDDLEEL